MSSVRLLLVTAVCSGVLVALSACGEPQGICRVTCPDDAGGTTTDALNYETPSSCDEATREQSEANDNGSCTSQFQAY
jgi:hypothetical protein